jgi:hypothetical protein
VPFGVEGVPQRLKPDSLQSIYVRPEGRTLQKHEFFRKLFSRAVEGWIDPDSSRTVPAPDYLAAASISPGENGPELSNQPLRLFLATAIMLCIRARL